jgi:DivIVA domain-containing protein
MIDLTPLDVRKKRGDFRKAMRGYEPQEVDSFLELVAERLEELVKELITLRERTAVLQAQVDAQVGREKAVQDALVTAQSLRDQINDQARREADMVGAQSRREAEMIAEQTRREAEMARREAEAEARRIVADAERQLEERKGALEEVERKRTRFLTTYRRLLERELDMVVVEEGRPLLEDAPVELELSGGQRPMTPGASGAGDDIPLRGGPVKGDLWLGLADESPIPAPKDEELAG